MTGAVRGALGAEFLAEDGVVRERAAQVLADGALGGLVGLGDGGAVGLGFGGDGPEAREDLGARPVGGGLRRARRGCEIERSHGA